MNGPILNIKNIETYGELLPEGYIEETKKRKELLSNNMLTFGEHCVNL